MLVSAEDEETPCFASNDNARRGTQPLASDFALACKPSPAVQGWASPQDREDKKRDHGCAGHRTPLDPIPEQRITTIIPEPGRQSAEIDIRSDLPERSEEHTSELQSLMRTSYAVLCLKKK